MREAEETTAGVDHVQVGSILARNWELAAPLQQVIAHHHAPTSDAIFTQLISLSSFLAGAFYPYPAKAEFPPTRMVERIVSSQGEQMAVDVDDDEMMQSIAAFLPDGLLEYIGLDLKKILQLSFVLGPDIRTQIEEISASMKD